MSNMAATQGNENFNGLQFLQILGFNIIELSNRVELDCTGVLSRWEDVESTESNLDWCEGCVAGVYVEHLAAGWRLLVDELCFLHSPPDAVRELVVQHGICCYCWALDGLRLQQQWTSGVQVAE